MDIIKFVSKFSMKAISKLASVIVRNKLGCDVDIQFNELNASITDEKMTVHLNADAQISKEELLRILQNTGLE